MNSPRPPLDPGPPSPSYVRQESLPWLFCPGCGHAKTSSLIDYGLRSLGKPPEQVVMVTDIGCIGLTDRHFAVSAFHGLHGRSVTYATGIKLANPDLTVIVVMGDGGTGIGGGHLLAAARRNIGICVIVANNFNYGMTGGQQSVTTPLEGITSTTPLGNLEVPLDIMATLAPSRPSFLARTTVYAEEAPDLVARAMATDGFALVDIWSPCVAYYAGRNALNRESMGPLMTSLAMPAGIHCESDRPEFGRAYREVYHRHRGAAAAAASGAAAAPGGAPAPRGFEPLARSALAKPCRLLISGSAGLKIRSIATVLGAGALLSGLHATQKDDYPVTVRTGHSAAEVIVSPDPIVYTGVDVPDVVLILSSDGLSHLKKRLPAFPPTTRVFIEQDLGPIDTPAQVTYLPLQDAARKVHRLALAAVGVGAVLGAERLYGPEAFAEAARRLQPEQVAANNIAGLRLGLELVRERGEGRSET
jgi:pyruvate/2-oxoacid:ferredoxin oxidoreductase beta subunit/Pyruvate/2-oxoacid:ferredoxin oxidoreductase gamma subunit